MKHILNNLSNEEKNRIREQHEGGMKVESPKFKKLMESKLGNSKPLVSEQGSMYSDFDLERMRSGEDMTYTSNKGDLRTDIMKMIYNSNSPNEDIIRTLRSIADEMESSDKVYNRFRDENKREFEASISERNLR